MRFMFSARLLLWISRSRKVTSKSPKLTHIYRNSLKKQNPKNQPLKNSISTPENQWISLTNSGKLLNPNRTKTTEKRPFPFANLIFRNNPLGSQRTRLISRKTFWIFAWMRRNSIERLRGSMIATWVLTGNRRSNKKSYKEGR